MERVYVEAFSSNRSEMSPTLSIESNTCMGNVSSSGVFLRSWIVCFSYKRETIIEHVIAVKRCGSESHLSGSACCFVQLSGNVLRPGAPSSD